MLMGMTAFHRYPGHPGQRVPTELTLVHEERGAAIVEMALVLPLLLALLMGVLVYGQYFMLAHSVQQAARPGCQLQFDTTVRRKRRGPSRGTANPV